MRRFQTEHHGLLWGCVLMVVAMFGLSHLKKGQTGGPRVAIQSLSFVQDTVRADITFILGEDKSNGNPFYTEAANFYRYHEEERAEVLITHCRSVVEMRDYLLQHPPANGLPWGEIEVVVHSNAWQGMAAPVQPEGERTTVESLAQAMEAGTFLPLPDSILDQQSRFTIYGCGLGKNQELLELLSYAFGGFDDQRPEVSSSPYFIYFDSKKHNGMPYDCKRYLAQSWYTHYPSYSYPGDYRIAESLAKTYPDQEIDWKSALAQEKPDQPGDAFHMEFKIPIVWYVTYKDKNQRPTLNNPKAQVDWVHQQPELIAAAEQYGFEVDDFYWYVRKAEYTDADSVSHPAMKAIGFCSIVSVLKPIVTAPGSDRLQSVATDGKIISQPSQPAPNHLSQPIAHKTRPGDRRHAQTDR